MKRYLLCLPLLFLGCTSPTNLSQISREAPANPPTSASVLSAEQQRLIELLAERLEISRHVAWYKFREDLPVRDPEREATAREALVARGEALGIPPRRTTRFFDAQMAASRSLQANLIQGWQRGRPLPALAPMDLARDIRPRIDAINDELLDLLVKLGPSARSHSLASQAHASLRQNGYPLSAVNAAVSALR